MQIPLDVPSHPVTGPALFRAGFRPFFLLAGLQAALMVPVWLVLWLGGHDLALSYAPMLWHGHEMLFGFAGAAIAGFLLTAVPNWTGAAPLAGRPLIALTLLWLAGRLAFDLGGLIPPLAAALPAILFFPALGLSLAGPLIAARKPRNLIFLPLLAALSLAQLAVLGEMAGIGSFGINGLWGALFLVLVMIAIIGGRIIPSFTVNGLKMAGIQVTPRSHPWLERAGIAAVLLTGLAWVIVPESRLAGALALAAGLLTVARMAGWHGWRTGAVPLLWVLHAGFAWLAVGLLLLGLAPFAPSLPSTLALHGLTVGCAGLMVLGVMSRAALGHGGRALVPHRLTVLAYWLVLAAAVIRVFGPLLAPEEALIAAGLLWSAAFALFTAVYAPICLAPRADGRPG